MSDTQYIRLRHLTDTSANWSISDPILEAGRIAVESDTSLSKLGDGVTTWNNLPYVKSLASFVLYDNSISDLWSTNVQDAIDELYGIWRNIESMGEHTVSDYNEYQYVGTDFDINGDGSVAVVVAPEGSEISYSGRWNGVAYVYLRGEDGVWVEDQKLMASYKSDDYSDGSNGYKFGNGGATVSGDGNYIAVGTWLEHRTPNGSTTEPETYSGGVYVYERKENFFTKELEYVEAKHIIEPGGRKGLSQFGFRVKLSNNGQTLVVGCPFYGRYLDEGLNFSGDEEGRFYVYFRHPHQSIGWTLEGFIDVPKQDQDDYGGKDTDFAYRIAVDDNGTVAANSFKVDRVHIYDRVKDEPEPYAPLFSSHKHVQTLESPDGETGFGNGLSFSSEGGFLAVGSTNNSVYMYEKKSTEWELVQRIPRVHDDTGGKFGDDVDLSRNGKVLIVGSMWQNSPEDSYEGRVYIFVRTVNKFGESRWVLAQDVLNPFYPYIAEGGYTQNWGESVRISDDGFTMISGSKYIQLPPNPNNPESTWDMYEAGMFSIMKAAP